MGFTADVKRELVTVMPAAEHCRRAQLSGLLFGAGVFDITSGGHFGVRVSVALPAVARHLLALLKPLQVDASLRTADSAPIGLRYEVLLGDEGRDLQVLNELGVLSDDLAVQMNGAAAAGGAPLLPRRLPARALPRLRLHVGAGGAGARRVHRRGRELRGAGPAPARAAGPALLAHAARAQRGLLHQARTDGRRPARRARRPRLVPALGGARGVRHGARERQPAGQLRRGQRAPGGGGRPSARPRSCARSWTRPSGRTCRRRSARSRSCASSTPT